MTSPRIHWQRSVFAEPEQSDGQGEHTTDLIYLDKKRARIVYLPPRGSTCDRQVSAIGPLLLLIAQGA